MIYADHQPSLFPWYPYLYKVLKSDKFIVMTQVAFTKDDSYVHRCAMKGTRITLPISKEYVGQPISTVEAGPHSVERLRKSMENSYGKKDNPYRERLEKIIQPMTITNRLHVAPFNVMVLDSVLKLMRWKGELAYDAAPEGLTKTARSINRLRGEGMKDGDTYLCGLGTLSYLDNTFPFPVSVQLIANAEQAPSLLDGLLKVEDLRHSVMYWCDKNVTHTDPLPVAAARAKFLGASA